MGDDGGRWVELARAWMADDPDPVTRAELEALVVANDAEALRERFSAPLEFGTAGLRGLIGAGLARMNEANLARVAAGLARQLLADVPDAAFRGVMLGRDGRRKSDDFARVVAEVLVGQGVRVYWVPQPASTPVVAFLGRYVDAAATAIVTASHNPPAYNGFKVYSERGAQIVPPQDARIRAQMDAIPSVRAIPRVPFAQAVAEKHIRVVPDRWVDAYYEALDDQCLGPVPPPTQIAAVTTALHGVGHRFVHEVLARRGHRHLFPVLAQAAPDGEFPTVRFPNPEEKGALDLALALARDKFAEVIVANDPDTDRLCVAVRDPKQATGYRVLTGNELGLLLADWLLSEGARQGTLPERPLVVTTIVSTMMLARLAEARGAACAEVLTGFKWIWDYALSREGEGETFVFGFEEALGYCCGRAVRDKDGIGAAATLMELAAALKAEGKTLLDRLDALAAELGVSVTAQVATVLAGLDGMARMARIMAALRASPPTAIGGSPVSRQRDLAGADADAAGLPRADVLTYWLGDGSRLVVRPSGTEPKLKAYLEAREAAGEGEPLGAARARAEGRVAALDAWVREFIASVA
ncbi:MAG: phospho-sugar mutase [Deltaproteobacteria bacterium HGW-Deltaproteobacteria-14]|nr:MAG: phospho-sugar mutase [Deltaproteobacteria bacterium HGW-Deltaproteobacteria-14]